MTALTGIAAEEPIAAALLVVGASYLVVTAALAPAVAACTDRDAIFATAFLVFLAGVDAGTGSAEVTRGRAGPLGIAALGVLANAIEVAVSAGIRGAIAIVATVGAVRFFLAVVAAELALWAFRNDGAEVILTGNAGAEGRIGIYTVIDRAALATFVPDSTAADATGLGNTGAAFASGAVATGVFTEAAVAGFARATVRRVATFCLADTIAADAARARSVRAVVGFATRLAGGSRACVW